MMSHKDLMLALLGTLVITLLSLNGKAWAAPQHNPHRQTVPTKTPDIPKTIPTKTPDVPKRPTSVVGTLTGTVESPAEGPAAPTRAVTLQATVQLTGTLTVTPDLLDPDFEIEVTAAFSSTAVPPAPTVDIDELVLVPDDPTPTEAIATATKPKILAADTPGPLTPTATSLAAAPTPTAIPTREDISILSSLTLMGPIGLTSLGVLLVGIMLAAAGVFFLRLN